MMELPEFSELTFEEKTHQYKLNGFEIPSVTTIMKPLSSAHYKTVDEQVLKKAASRGTTVHEAVENYLLFGVEDIPPELEGYFLGFKKWIMDFNPVPIKPECKIYHKTLGYAGTADLPCYIKEQPTLVDLKTTATIAKMLTRVQLEAYKKAFESHGFTFTRKLIVQARNDGTYGRRNSCSHLTHSWRRQIARGSRDGERSFLGRETGKSNCHLYADRLRERGIVW